LEIYSERCTIRRFREEDIDNFMQYRNDLEWMRYQGFKGLTREEYKKALLKDSALTDGIQLAIIDNAVNRLIGDIYLKQENDTFWIGYTISLSKSRQGYTYEVVAAMIDWLRHIGGACAKAGVSPENLASISLLKKLKFTYSCTDDSGDQIFILNLQQV